MMDLRDLYQEVILDHNKRPRNRGRLEDRTHHSEGYNPLCGDAIVLDLKEVDGVIVDVKFDGQGCAISTASASLMTEAIKGKRREEVEALFEETKAMLTGKEGVHIGEIESELAALSGVREFPVRIKCAVLPWNALHAALTSTEVKYGEE